MKYFLNALCSSLLALGALSCSSDHGHEHGPDGEHIEEHAHGETGPNGGHLIELGGEVAHLEMLHDDATGTVTLHVLGPDAKTPLTLAAAPQLKLKTTAGPLVLDMQPAGAASTYTASTDELKSQEPEGRVSLVVGGKSYSPELAHDH